MEDATVLNDIHRIGGGSVENLLLKPKESKLNSPGISVLKTLSSAEAVRQIRQAFPDAEGLHEAAQVSVRPPPRRFGAPDSI